MNETIINGIDVSECCFYNNGKCDNPNGMACNCINNAVCYFKEFKHLQEENKRLQMLSCANCGEKYLSPDGAELYEKNVQLQKENEELKQNWRLDCLKCEYKNTKADVDKYKQALEEIREMTSVNAINTCWEILNTCDDCKSKKDCGIQSPITKLKFIENKIDEALNDRD